MRRPWIMGRYYLALWLFGAIFLIAPISSSFSAALWAASVSPSDTQLAASIRGQLKGKHYRNIVVRVNKGAAMLSGEVDLFAYKAEAVEKAHKVKGVQAVRDNIAVGGPVLPDDVLAVKLLRGVEVDRVGYGQVFDAIGVSVRNGVVTLAGHALGPAAKRSAISLVEFTPGVKGVIDRISIDPTSSVDDAIRIQTYRAIYGLPALRRYAIVPLRPIRISVQNSKVTLYGIVDSTMDKQLAYQSALAVPGVFKVTDHLIVQPPKQEATNRP